MRDCTCRDDSNCKVEISVSISVGMNVMECRSQRYCVLAAVCETKETLCCFCGEQEASVEGKMERKPLKGVEKLISSYI